MEIKVLHQVMDWNEDVSEEVKAVLAARHICMINVMGSPGAGKTSLITALINRLKEDFRIGVGIEYEYNPIERRMKPRFMFYPAGKIGNFQLGR